MKGIKEDKREIILVVDVSSFTKQGFVGSSVFNGRQIDIEFDDIGNGIVLSNEMSRKINAKTNSAILVIGEDEQNPIISELNVRSIGNNVSISDPKVYYFIGRNGGGILRIRKR